MVEDLRLNIILPNNLAKDTKKYVKEFGYTSIQELLREALREKIYGKTRAEEIENKKLILTKEEEEFLLKENKNIYNKLKKISNKL